MSFWLAVKFLTALPVPWSREAGAAELGRALVYFPLVGGLIGLLLALSGGLLGLLLPTPVVNALVVLLLVLLTGALHLDGLADTCDGLGGHKPPEARLEVMRDSRIGGFGAVGIALALLLKYVLLNNVPGFSLLIALILMPLLSRWAMVYAIFAYPYARAAGLGLAFKQGATARRFVVATLLTLAMAAGLTWLTGLAYAYFAGIAVMAGVWLVTGLAAAYLKGKLGGLTGDTYGAIGEIGEIAALLMLILLAHNGWLGMR